MLSPSALMRALACVAVIAIRAAGLVSAQEPVGSEPFPGQSFLLTGYGFVMYDARVSGPFGHDFTMGLSPVLLFQSGTDVIFSNEFEVEFEEGEARIGVEYAKVSYQ